jgi:mRNA interferase MazF
MTRYSKGDVILVPLPFSDQTTTKKRPAVIVNSDRGIRIELSKFILK